MAGRTISASYAGGITLLAADNPTTVTATGTVANTDAAALMTTGTADWVIGNAGTIAASGTAAASVGIQMSGTAGSAGGTITNAATGAISGGQFGIYSKQAATLVNAGTVSAAGATTVSTVGTVTSTIASAVGVLFGTGRVENAGGISGTKYGIYLIGAGTVANTGTIAGAGYSGVVLNGGGLLSNTGTKAAVTGGRQGAYLFGTGTVVNSGSIGGTGTGADGVLMVKGGSLDNQVGGQVTGTGIGVRATGTIATAMTNAGGIAGGNYGVLVLYSPLNLTNAATGTITAAATNIGAAVGAGSSGSIGNAGSISGRFGVLLVGAGATATNSGIVRSTGKNSIGENPEAVGAGIQLRNGGTITNLAGGTISGYWIGTQIGSFSGNNPNGGAVLNAGTITANDPGVSGAAIWFKGNGLISNAASGTIAGGPFGIVSYNTVTVANRGRIAGDQFAVFTSATGTNNRIIVYPGASFAGTVLGDKAGVAAPTGVLQLASGAASGTITGFGTSFQSFGRVQVDAGATWSLAGTVASGQTVALGGAGAALTLANPGSVAGVISGFDATTTLVLGGVADVTGSSLNAGTNVLTLTRGGGGTIALRFDPGQSFPPGSFGFAAGAGGTTLSAPCFALGTRIATPDGEVAVEALAAGMRVLLARGGAAEVAWVGHRRVACRHHPRPEEVWPVRVAAGAFGRGVPCRDLLLSPDHAVYAGGVLIPVRHLVNGRTVRQEPVDSVTYFHVELGAHDVLLAEGLACESYLDTGNRSAFANGGGAMMLHADFARRAWAEGACAPLVEAGPEVAAVRARLLARAGALGHRRGPDPGLAVLAGGRVLASGGGGRWREVAVPAGTGAVALASRSWVPAEMEGSADARRLGVAVGRVMLDGAPVAAGDARFGAGWHAPEGDWRWSDGMGWLHLRGARHLRFEVAASGVYWLGDAA